MYRKQIILAFGGVAVLATPYLISFVPKASAYLQAQYAEAQAQLKRDEVATKEKTYRDRIVQQAQTSETLYKSGVAADTKNLRIVRFVDNGKTDPKPDASGYSSSQLVKVFDSNGKCIGEIKDNTWYWLHKYKNACK